MRLSKSTLRRLADATVAWSIAFALAHFYWAAGGDAGMTDDVSGAGAALYVGFVAVVGLAGAAVARGLDRPWGARVGLRRLRTLALAGGTALFVGVVVGVGRWAADGSIGDDGVAGVAITVYFLLGAVLFAALGLGTAEPARVATRRTSPRPPTHEDRRPRRPSPASAPAAARGRASRR
jgi:hypothetical protein